jgi:hypothetical protein
MAVERIGVSNLITTNGGAPGAITANASTAIGDLLVWFHYSRATGGNETVSFPSGWDTVFNSVTANQGLVAVATRIRQSGDGTYQASITNHTSGTSGETVLQFIETFRGADPTTPIVNFTASLSTWASSLTIGSIAAPATATVNPGDAVVVFGGRFENVTGQTTLTGDNLTWAQGTRIDTTLGLDAGAVTQIGRNLSGSNQTVTAKSITTTGTAQTGAGRMFIIEAFVPVLDAEKGSFTLGGKNADLEAGRKVIAEKGSFALTGKDAEFTVEGGAVDYPIEAEKGSFTLTGKDVSFKVDRYISAEKGSYSLTGKDATLTAQKSLSAEKGSFSLTGKDVTFTVVRAYTIEAEKGLFSLTGKDATLSRTYRIEGEKAVYSITGKDVTFTTTRRLEAEKGSYSLTGKDATLTYTPVGATILSAEKGTFNLTGRNADLKVNRILLSQKGNIIVTGKDADFRTTRVLQADKGSYTIEGKDAQLVYAGLQNLTLSAERGYFVLSGKDATLTGPVRIAEIIFTGDSRISQVVSLNSRIDGKSLTSGVTKDVTGQSTITDINLNSKVSNTI